LLHALPASIGTTAYVENQSLFGFIARFFVEGTSYEAGKATVIPVAKWITIFLSGVLVVLSVYFGRKSRDEAPVYACWVPVLLLILPFSWSHYEVVMLFPIALLFYDQQRTNQDSVGWVVLILSYALLAFSSPETLQGPAFFTRSYKFYAILLLWWLCIRDMLRNQEAQTVAKKNLRGRLKPSTV
jgi:hypothetical protein